MLRSIALTFAVALLGSFIGGLFGVATAVYLELAGRNSWTDYSGEPPSVPTAGPGWPPRRPE